MAPRLLIIGLDSVPPHLLFERYAHVMPFVTALRQRGRYGPLRSTDPPITVPAWVSLTSGRTPAELGLYGFRQMPPQGRALCLPSAADVPHPRLWNLACAAGLRSAVVSVPLTWPLPAHPHLHMTADFLAPGTDSPWATPPALQDELHARFGPYRFDVDHFRHRPPADVAADVHDFSRQHFAIFRHLLTTRRPHFGMLVDLGPDRFHHALLSQMRGDALDPGGKYYALLDAEIAQTAALAGPETLLMLVSDHGVKPLQGVCYLNEWLWQAGYLVLHAPPRRPTPLSKADVDWARTRAWAEGGYHGRIYLNTPARSPQSRLRPADAAATLAALHRDLAALPLRDGTTLHNRVFTASELYGPDFVGQPPDLTVYCDDLNLRANATLGTGTLLGRTNDTGADDANHDHRGIYLLVHPKGPSLSHLSPLGELPITEIFHLGCAALGLSDAPSPLAGRP
ncbi:MAG: alkaline phosphatase family protein [Proteobacteria bacterium]|nr:alkaline phosphatase family protein [Pseudomonadota bacterium]